MVGTIMPEHGVMIRHDTGSVDRMSPRLLPMRLRQRFQTIGR